MAVSKIVNNSGKDIIVYLNNIKNYPVFNGGKQGAYPAVEKVVKNGETLRSRSVSDGEYARLQGITGVTCSKVWRFYFLTVAGQSNAVGWDESPLTKEDVEFVPYAYQLGLWYTTTSNGAFLPFDFTSTCADNFQNVYTGVKAQRPALYGLKGVQKPLAELLVPAIPDDYELLVMSAAYGGASMLSGNAGTMDTANRPSTNCNSWKAGSAFRLATIARMKFVLQLSDGLSTSSQGPVESSKLLGIVWCQGEADASNKANFEAWKTSFNGWFDQLKTGLAGYSAANRPDVSIQGKFVQENQEADENFWIVYNGPITRWSAVGGANNCFRQQMDFYREKFGDNFIEIPETVDTNLVNGTGWTSSDKAGHYGNNAFRDYIAPKIAERAYKCWLSK